jgi:hypothetical protein
MRRRSSPFNNVDRRRLRLDVTPANHGRRLGPPRYIAGVATPVSPGRKNVRSADTTLDWS